MADEQEKTGKARRLKSQPTFREKAVRQQTKEGKTSRRTRAGGILIQPARRIREIGKKEIYLGKNTQEKSESGAFLHKKRSLAPSYFRNAWKEVRQVTWPSRGQAWRLTFAVFVFSVIFATIISLADYGLDKLFKQLLLK